MRKALVTTFILALSVPIYANVRASYVIKLRNGNEITTNRYWPEGGQILFETAGGIFGIEKDSIGNIRKSTRPVTPFRATANSRSQAAGEAPQIEATEKIKKAESPPASRPATKDADPILKEFYALKSRFSGLKGMLTSELTDFARDVARFRKEVRQSERVNNYINELAETSAMEDELSAELRSRSQ